MILVLDPLMKVSDLHAVCTPRNAVAVRKQNKIHGLMLGARSTDAMTLSITGFAAAMFHVASQKAGPWQVDVFCEHFTPRHPKRIQKV